MAVPVYHKKDPEPKKDIKNGIPGRYISKAWPIPLVIFHNPVAETIV